MQFARIHAGLLLGAVMSLTPALAQTDTDALPPPTAQSDSDADIGVAGHFQFRIRGLAVIPEAGGKVTAASKPLANSLSITKSSVPEVDATYFITDHVGVEVIAAATQHSAHLASVGDLGSVWLLPPTVTAQYHFDAYGPIRPYVGAGVNYTWFFSPRSGAVPGMKYTGGFGGALQAGVDIPLGDYPFFLNVDVKQLLLNTGIKADGGLVRAHANINPTIVGAGIGIRL